MATFVVTDPGDSLTDGAPTPNTLRWAVEQADLASQPDDPSVIEFDLGKGPTTIPLTQGPLELSNTAVAITIDGPGADALTIDAGGKSQVFAIDPGVTASISGLTVAGGTAPGDYGAGGDLYNGGTLTLTGVTVRGGSAYAGGGLSNSGTATLVDSTIADNLGNRGAGLENGGTMTLEDCTVTGNTGVPGPGLEYSSTGGGILNWGSATLEDCTVSGNTASAGGGIYSGYYGALTVEGGAFTGNTAGVGSALYGHYGPGAISLTGTVVSGNSGRQAIYVGANLTVSGCTISGNEGGGLENVNGTIQLTGTTISGNDGPGLLTWFASSTLTACTISNNAGSGLYGFFAELTLTGCTISGNRASVGGGIDNVASTDVLTDCTIADNEADGAGGGIADHPGSWPFAGYRVGVDELNACTISGNSGGGLAAYGQATLADTIVAGNTGPGGQALDISGKPGSVTGSYNLVGTGGSGGLVAADHNLLNIADPGLTPLGDYGGPTETMALQPNSPARHAGTLVGGVTTDQRGLPLDSPPDIGAFQSQPGPLVVDTAIDGLGSPPGEMSLRQAVNLADVLDGGSTITFDRSVFRKPATITLAGGPLELSNTTGPVTILGPGAGRLAISGGGASRVLQVDVGATATVSGLTITGGLTSGDGGGVLNDGTATLIGVAIVGNSAEDGGGLYNAGTAAILGSTIDDNDASGDGGGIENAGSLTMTLDDLSGNSAGGDGGGLFNSGTAALIFCTVEGNTAVAGGGIDADPSGSPVVLIGTTVWENKGGNILGRVWRL